MIALLLLCCLYNASAQNSDVIVDDEGIMRWKDSNIEVHGFGVNYTVPFAHAYRSAQKMGIDPKKAIDQDVYHFSRLGFDLYRIHIWDSQISDSTGNLLKNQHLDTFDYLISKLKEKGIRYVLTPIAYWGDGWPEPDSDTPGFSSKYGKDGCLTDPNCFEAQQNYLYQFVNHTNPYTGLAYKEDPGVIAFEVSNEPHHREAADEVTDFVSAMVSAIRKTGTEKPIFYNASHAVHLAETYFKGGIQGGTFQWYPTGLGYQQEIPGNVLPNVNDYNIPFEEAFTQNKGAKLVYEFDAADVGRSYVYPAMARSFRTAGIQIGTHFAYDPTYLAYANTEYNTHYMNLVYTPKKALSLMITGKAFHELPLYEAYGTYPDNTQFGNISVNYEKDLALYRSDEEFIYTNDTELAPSNPKKLQRIAGYGNSSIVQYDGTGAYFLDKIDKGVWRLEVMPDALWVSNPFGRNGLDKTVGAIQWNTREMTLNLSDLGSNFTPTAINEGNTFSPAVTGTSFSIRPGTYIVSKAGKKQKWTPEDTFGYNQLKDFYAPESRLQKPYLIHEMAEEITEGKSITLEAKFISPQAPKNIQAIVFDGYRPKYLNMKASEAFTYKAEVPTEMIKMGYLTYYLLVEMADGSFRTYPANKEGKPFDWDFSERKPYEIKVVPNEYPIHLFNALDDTETLARPWRTGFKVIPTEQEKTAEYQIRLEKLFVEDPENKNATPIYDYTFKHYVLDEINGRKEDLTEKKKLIIHARSLSEKTEIIQVAIVLSDGSSFGSTIRLTPEQLEYEIALDDLKAVKTVTMPRPYPSFLPYYFEHANTATFNIEEIEALQISIGPGIPEDELKTPHAVGIRSIRLE